MSHAVQTWSLDSWKRRHEQGYFPKSTEHRDWVVYSEMPDWFLNTAQPVATDNALEIGCGYGEWMIPLSRIVNWVSGFDIHPEPIKKAIEKFNEHKVYNCSVGLGSGVSAPYALGTFSLVYSISVFQHLPRSMVKEYLGLTRSLMAEGGRCFHHFRRMTKDGEGGYPRPADDIELDHKGDFSCGWTREQILSATEEAGIRNIQVEEQGLFLLLKGTK